MSVNTDYLIGALSECGKLGVVGIGHSPAHAAALYQESYRRDEYVTKLRM